MFSDLFICEGLHLLGAFARQPEAEETRSILNLIRAKQEP